MVVVWGVGVDERDGWQGGAWMGVFGLLVAVWGEGVAVLEGERVVLVLGVGVVVFEEEALGRSLRSGSESVVLLAGRPPVPHRIARERPTGRQ